MGLHLCVGLWEGSINPMEKKEVLISITTLIEMSESIHTTFECFSSSKPEKAQDTDEIE